MMQLRVVPAQHEHAPVLGADPHVLRSDRDDVGALAVDEPALVVVACPAHGIAGLEQDRLGLVELEPIAEVARGVDPAGPAVGMLESYALALDPGDAAGIAPPHGDAVHIMVENRDIAFAVVPGIAFLRSGQVQIDVALGGEHPPVQHPLGGKARAHRGVDLAA